MIIEIRINQPLNLKHTLECGQVFRWRKAQDWYIGVIDRSVVKLKIIDNKLIADATGKIGEERIHDYLRLDDDLNKILTLINKDKLVSSAITLFKGLRIIRQDPWECLASFICSINSNINRISKTIEKLCMKLGDPIISSYHAFPTPQAIVKAGIKGLRECGLGFRAKYLFEAAKQVEESFDLYSLVKEQTDAAISKLTQLPGVGLKVASCVALFSLNKLDAFPVDRWIKRVMITYYLRRESTIREITSFARSYFGKYAGYANQYLFHYVRTVKPRKIFQ